MYLKGIKKKDVMFILECLKWNRFSFSLKPKADCQDKQYTLNLMTDIENRLKEALKPCNHRFDTYAQR